MDIYALAMGRTIGAIWWDQFWEIREKEGIRVTDSGDHDGGKMCFALNYLGFWYQ